MLCVKIECTGGSENWNGKVACENGLETLSSRGDKRKNNKNSIDNYAVRSWKIKKSIENYAGKMC
jgi:hypothetical protein